MALTSECSAVRIHQVPWSSPSSQLLFFSLFSPGILHGFTPWCRFRCFYSWKPPVLDAASAELCSSSGESGFRIPDTLLARLQLKGVERGWILQFCKVGIFVPVKTLGIPGKGAWSWLFLLGEEEFIPSSPCFDPVMKPLPVKLLIWGLSAIPVWEFKQWEFSWRATSSLAIKSWW